MHLTDQIQIRQDAYDAKDGRLQAAETERVICILMPASVLVAALDIKNECIAIRYSRNDRHYPGWDAHFYEKVLGNELMIRSKNALKHVYTVTEKQLLIPDGMHQQEQSRNLLRDIFHVGADDETGAASCRADKAQLVYACDLAVREIAARYTGTTEIRPVNLFQFQKTEKNNGYLAGCMLTEREAYLTLRHQGRLLWHHAVSYSNAEDIAYHILHACREAQIPGDLVQLACTAVFPDADIVMSRLKQFLPLTETADTDRWAPVRLLLQQVGACAS